MRLAGYVAAELTIAATLLAGGVTGATFGIRRPPPGPGAARHRAGRPAGGPRRPVRAGRPARLARVVGDVPGDVGRAAAGARAHAAHQALQAEPRRFVDLVPRRLRGRVAGRLEAAADQQPDHPPQGGRRLPAEPAAGPERRAAGRAPGRLARGAALAPAPGQPGVRAAHPGRGHLRPRRQDAGDCVVLDPRHQGLRVRQGRGATADAGLADARRAPSRRTSCRWRGRCRTWWCSTS